MPSKNTFFNFNNTQSLLNLLKSASLITQNVFHGLVFGFIAGNHLKKSCMPGVGISATLNTAAETSLTILDVVKEYQENKLTKLKIGNFILDTSLALTATALTDVAIFYKDSPIQAPSLFTWATLITLMQEFSKVKLSIQKEIIARDASPVGELNKNDLHVASLNKVIVQFTFNFIKLVGMVVLLTYDETIGQAMNNADQAEPSNVNNFDKGVSITITAMCSMLMMSFLVEFINQAKELYIANHEHAESEEYMQMPDEEAANIQNLARK